MLLFPESFYFGRKDVPSHMIYWENYWISMSLGTFQCTYASKNTIFPKSIILLLYIHQLNDSIYGFKPNTPLLQAPNVFKNSDNFKLNSNIEVTF